jgi:hypothetical protein
MATTVDVEFVFPLYGNFNEGLNDGQPATPVRGLAVTGVATAAESRPVVPTGPDSRRYYAVVTALGGPVYVAWGADPTATSNGLRVDPGGPRAITCNPGDKLSFITAPDVPAEIGKINTRHFNIAGTTLTRPTNTTPYSANDSVSDNATAGSVTALPVTVSDTNDDPVNVTQVLLDTTDTGFGGKTVRVHVFNSDPTASTGVGAGDNAAWSQKRAGWVGSFSGTMTAFSDGAKGVLIPDGPTVLICNPETGGKRLWWQLQTLSDATPSANSTTFTPRFKGYQGRV